MDKPQGTVRVAPDATFFQPYRQSPGVSSRATRVDLVILILLSLILVLISAYFDGLEMLVEWSMQYEDYEIDEIITLLIFLAFGIAIFSMRRIRDLRKQIELFEA